MLMSSKIALGRRSGLFFYSFICFLILVHFATSAYPDSLAHYPISGDNPPNEETAAANQEARLSMGRMAAEKTEGGEPLIGHGFDQDEVNRVKLTPWQDNKEFVESLKTLERVIMKGRNKYKLPLDIRRQLLKTLGEFKAGKYGRQLGMAPARYMHTGRYYLGFGTNRSIGIAPEFFDSKNAFYEYRLQALFHELFHASRAGDLDDQDIEENVEAHLDAIRLSALLFWDLNYKERKLAQWSNSKQLEAHHKNNFGALIRAWKKDEETRGVPWVMKKDDWKTILAELRGLLRTERRTKNPRDILDYLIACNEAASADDNWRYPIESRYPVMRAAALLDKKDQDLLIDILGKNERYRKLPVVDSILLMLSRDISEGWLEKYAPNLVGRNIWQASAEIWHAAGGLGRVMQYHGTAIYDLLGKHKDRLKHIEPYYHWRQNAAGDLVAMDYKSKDALANPIVDDLQEVERFSLTIGNRGTEAIVYKGHNDIGIEVYLIKDRDGFFTHSLYNYNNSGDRQDLPTWEQFTEFISKATLELVRRQEEKAQGKDSANWKAPVLHVNDAQFSLVGVDRLAETYKDQDEVKKYADNPLVQKIMLAFTTHTYDNREARSGKDGVNRLGAVHVPEDFWHHFLSYREGWMPYYDFTSTGIRLSDWAGGVSRKQIRDVDKWDSWTGATPVAVTNGDDRERTAQAFREILTDKSVFPDEDVDIEHPTPLQILRAKQEAKRRLKLIPEQYHASRLEADGSILNPDQYVIAYTGRLVNVKAGRLRAFTDDNIKALVKAGHQVLIYGNVQNSNESHTLEAGLKALVEELKGEKYAHWAGKLVFVPRFGLKEQREAFGAIDIGVVDSHAHTEAAGFSETDFAVAGALVLSPPWPGGEGILVDQGIRLNPDIFGEGNTIVPDIDIKEEDIGLTNLDTSLRKEVEKAYLKIMLDTLSIRPKDLAKYQATSVRLSRVLEARMTGAEYLRQWSDAVAGKEGILETSTDAPSADRPSGNFRKADEEMRAIHELNQALKVPEEEETVIYHIIPRSLLPQGINFNQQNKFCDFVKEFNRLFPDSGEKLWVVTDRQMKDPSAIISGIQSREKRGVVVDFAVDSESMLSRLPEGTRALIFEPENGNLGDFRQLEGIIAALRALYIKDYKDRVDKLSRIYKLLTNKEAPQIKDEEMSYKQFAILFKFILPAIEIKDPKELKRLNDRLEYLIRHA